MASRAARPPSPWQHNLILSLSLALNRLQPRYPLAHSGTRRRRLSYRVSRSVSMHPRLFVAASSSLRSPDPLCLSAADSAPDPFSSRLFRCRCFPSDFTERDDEEKERLSVGMRRGTSVDARKAGGQSGATAAAAQEEQRRRREAHEGQSDGSAVRGFTRQHMCLRVSLTFSPATRDPSPSLFLIPFL